MKRQYTSTFEQIILKWYRVTANTESKDLGVLIGNFFLPSIHFKEAAPKARRMMFMIRWSFVKLCVSPFVAHFSLSLKLAAMSNLRPGV